MNAYTVDPHRVESRKEAERLMGEGFMDTRFYIRALDPETQKFGSYDVIDLDRESFQDWFMWLDSEGKLLFVLTILRHIR